MRRSPPQRSGKVEPMASRSSEAEPIALGSGEAETVASGSGEAELAASRSGETEPAPRVGRGGAYGLRIGWSCSRTLDCSDESMLMTIRSSSSGVLVLVPDTTLH